MPKLSASHFAYVVDQYRHTGPDSPSYKDPGPFVTLSRESGSGGASISKMLARRLNKDAPSDVMWKIFDGNLMAAVLKANHLQPQLAKFLPEDRVPEFKSTIEEMVGLHPNLWDLIKKINETICQMAKDGHVILVGRGANFATTGVSHGLHVRFVAPAALRAHYIAQRYDMTEEQAFAYNESCDAASRRYVKANFNADITAPANYDLVINTGHVSLVEAAELIANMVETRVMAAA